MCFLAKFDLFKPYLLPETSDKLAAMGMRQADRLLSGIPENFGYDCNLATVIRKFFLLLQNCTDE